MSSPEAFPFTNMPLSNLAERWIGACRELEGQGRHAEAADCAAEAQQWWETGGGLPWLFHEGLDIDECDARLREWEARTLPDPFASAVPTGPCEAETKDESLDDPAPLMRQDGVQGPPEHPEPAGAGAREP